MTGFELLLIWFGWVLAGASPGPATLGIAATAMNQGRTKALAFAAGILTGGAFWGLAAAFGMGALMLAHVWLFSVIKYAGAAYLLYLALKSLRSAFSHKELIDGAIAGGSHFSAFRKGALVHLTNPKAILSWGAVFSIILPPSASLSQIIGMFGFLYSGGILVFIGYALLFSTPAAVRVYRSARRGFELAFAGLFGAAGLKILTVRPE
ncbi:Threonine/homoserine/homoserine lactone efflux protein [Aliiroseovarius crassostreae]|uniref:Amino acid transporter n=1 Tax=Aliiroseovarius crassostreae TaxID=154981 RepID=A0A0P7JRF1_9RHOB|nr:LysE family transporter [Aliiroseovarius crassostreae]KPN63986.1 amino acid transporter [Aliiroseovarius crassostreae]SFU50940.1 Threonine/homoserine/homoserine lactone efflux protein [Aliiroseovarius crassostreae]